MKSRFIDQQFMYDGSQLKSLFAYLNYGLEGDSVLAWQGSCNIPFEKMIDGEDILAKSAICGENMLHFIAELYGVTLGHAVALQRLLAALAADTVRELTENAKLSCGTIVLRREGDDLYFGERKFSISIATVSPVSAMIHFAVNVDNRGTPVPTVSLSDFEVPVHAFAEKLLEKFANEVETIGRATRKVRPTTSF